MGGYLTPKPKEQIISDLTNDSERYKRALQSVTRAKTLREAKKIASNALLSNKKEVHPHWNLWRKLIFKHKK